MTTPSATLPSEVDPRRLARRTLTVVLLIGALILVVALAPGLGGVRRHLEHASPGWLVLGVVLEGLSAASYVLMFRPVFCPRMSWRTSIEIGLAEVGVGSLVPASGAGGLALGAWVLSRAGMPAEKIARRSVAFFLIKSSVNFLAVAVLGLAMALGLGPHQPLWRTLAPALLALAALAVVLAVPLIGPGDGPPEDAGRLRVLLSHARRAIVDGIDAAKEIVRHPSAALVAGAIGYWIFDNAVLWATYHAFGTTIPVTVLLMGYLIGQIGGLLPLPGGVGGIDGGLIGTLIVYGAPAAATTAAVLAYRVILFWVPLLLGAGAFISLRRNLGRAELCTA